MFFLFLRMKLAIRNVSCLHNVDDNLDLRCDFTSHLCRRFLELRCILQVLTLVHVSLWKITKVIPKINIIRNYDRVKGMWQFSFSLTYSRWNLRPIYTFVFCISLHFGFSLTNSTCAFCIASHFGSTCIGTCHGN